MGLRKFGLEHRGCTLTLSDSSQIGMLVVGMLRVLKSTGDVKLSGSFMSTTCFRCVVSRVHRAQILRHRLQSYTMGRPPSFSLAHIDCKKPFVEDPSNEETCEHPEQTLSNDVLMRCSSPLVETPVHVGMYARCIRPGIWRQNADLQHSTTTRSQTAGVPRAPAAADSRVRQYGFAYGHIL